jgi:membrane protease YdiL (CAAX protease family)
VSDDLTGMRGQYPPNLPEMPLVGPPQIPPPVTPPPPGTPPPGSTGSRGADGWRWYHAALAFVGGFIATQVPVLMLALAWSTLAGTDFEAIDDNSTFVLIASGINEVMFIVASYVVARMTGPVSRQDFGLRGAPLGQTLWKMGVVLVGYFVLLIVYSNLVHLAPDTAPDKLGAGKSDLHMLLFALLVGVLAPIAEEFLFRGFLYRALRNGLGIAGAAIVSGLFFGGMHIDAMTSERLLQVVPLALLGVLLALLYQFTGTLWSAIAVHATNNSIAVMAFASEHDSSLGIWLAVAIWLGMMAACLAGVLAYDERR